MRVRFVVHQAAIIAACLILLPGHIGAGEAPAYSKIRLASLVEVPEPAFPSADSRPETSLTGKWHAVRERMRRDERLVSLCRRDPAGCPSDAATLFMSIVDAARLREGKAVSGEINRAINLAVRPVSDQKRHGADVWTSPLTTLASGQGDCEDYAIAKLAALWAAGVAESDTRLVIVRDARAQEDHALAMVRLDGRWLALDNRRFTLIEAAHLAYRPLFVIGRNVVRAVSEPGSWAALDDDGAIGQSARDESGSSGGQTAPVLL
ncbi:MAG: transglutaminase-like cysteine peptidase [Pseudorhodoplanes sp.]|jgi:predicted transglutaminase-like cysteine proteinase|nr:transglutaminase-like cysteine peptidase [Pseudorhodoplanes sp.]